MFVCSSSCRTAGVLLSVLSVAALLCCSVRLKTERMDLMLSRSHLRQSNQRPASQTEQLAKECASHLIASKRFHSRFEKFLRNVTVLSFENTHRVQGNKKCRRGGFAKNTSSTFSVAFCIFCVYHIKASSSPFGFMSNPNTQTAI